MNLDDQNRFIEFAHIRRCDKCCGNCKHFKRDYEASGCAHPKQADFDTLTFELLMKVPDTTPESYGAYGGTDVDEGFVCDLWEAIK